MGTALQLFLEEVKLGDEALQGGLFDGLSFLDAGFEALTLIGNGGKAVQGRVVILPPEGEYGDEEEE
jgi:hypothetical protein